jgi:phospholipid/cholesterol/gamma-HCH transport system ATP-binding protein
MSAIECDLAQPDDEVVLGVEGLTMAFGERVVQRDVSFSVGRGEVFIVMGGSGCGKSTLLKHLIGLLEPTAGEVFYEGQSFTRADPAARARFLRGVGVLYQKGALWTSMTLAENIALVLQQYTDLSEQEIREQASLKLALVGLEGFEDYYPSEISGGMQKRAGLARALALDPRILLFDEPSAGLDPISSRRLDELILELRDSLGATVVVVTHELPSLLAIGDDSVMLDAEAQTVIARGRPRDLLESCQDERVQRFLRRGEKPA